MVWPGSCPARDRSWQGTPKTRSTHVPQSEHCDRRNRHVRPYSKEQKNDFQDAEAIAEAVQRPTMKFVATKTAEQLDLLALHRVRVSITDHCVSREVSLWPLFDIDV